MKERALGVTAGASFGLALGLRSASRIPVFDVVSGAPDAWSPPWLVTTLPPWWWLAATMGLCGCLGWLLPRRAYGPFLFAGLTAAGALVPFVFDVAPFLAAFSGRLLDLVLVAAALVVLSRMVPMPRSVSAIGVSALAGCVFVAVGLEMSRDVGLSGDEPHYLLIVHSVLEDGDLRVANNYLAGDYERFYRGKIGPHLATNTPYSVHGVGLPLLLVPGYAAAGLVGVVVTLALLGVLIVCGIFRIARALGVGDAGATLGALAFAVTSPALFLCVSAYPELPAAAVVTVITWRIASPSTNGRWQALVLALVIGALPFFHIKFIPLALVLWLALAYRGQRVAICVGALVAGTALMAFFYYTTGSIDPTSSYGRQRVFLSAIPSGLLGLVFDQEFGLLVYAPVYLAGLVGLVALVRRHPFVGLVALAVLGSVALPGAAHPLWSGGSSPPARFLFPALPLVALGVGCLWSWEKKLGVGPWLPDLFALSVAVGLFSVVLPGQPLYLNARDGTGRLWEALSSSWDLTSYLPSVVTADARSIACALAGVAVVIIALVLQVRGRAVRLPAFAWLLVAFFWIQDLTGVKPTRAQESRWVTSLWQTVAEERPTHLLALPSFERLDVPAVGERVPLRLEALRPDGDATRWWSLAYPIPAGRYAVRGVDADAWSPCYDRNCFDGGRAGFESAVAIARFRARVQRFDDPPPRLYFETLDGNGPLALRSLVLDDGRRLHGLDDEAYLDPKGFWVKAGARAELFLEPGGNLELANGGVANTALVHTASGVDRYELEPWQRVHLALPAGDSGGRFAVESKGGFRPMDLDPDSADYRELGVFVTEPPFDLGR